MLIANYQISFQDVEIVGTISDDHFGSIIVNKYGAYNHLDQAQDAGLSFFRFPGGTLAEHANVINGALILNDQRVTIDMLDGDRSSIGFDLTHPELISPLALFDDGDPNQPSDIISFSTALQFAVDTDTEFNLIIPVQRYFIGQDFTDPDVVRLAEEMARQDALIFAERLKSGDYNDGVLPKNLLIDIGNEPYNDPFAYAIIAKVFIETLDEELSGSDIAYELGFQMGNGSNTHRRLLEDGYFAAYLPDGIPAIDALDGFVAGDQATASFETRVILVDEAMLHILGDTAQKIDYVRHHHLAVDIDVLQDEDALFHQRAQIVDFWQSNITNTPDYYVSAWTTDASNTDDIPYSLAGAVNVLAMFRNFAETNVDRAALWGLVGAYNYAPDNMLPTVISDNTSGISSPSFEVLTLMSENIGNSNLLSVGSELELVDDQNNDFLLFAYESDEAYIVYIAVGELGGQEFSVELGLDGIVLPPTQTVQHLDILGGDASGAAIVTDVDYLVHDSGLNIVFDQDFEIAQVVLPKSTSQLASYEQALIANLYEQGIDIDEMSLVVGNHESNVIVGGSNNNIIFGRAGDDILSGGAGRVQYFSDDSDDINHAARDVIFGGLGNDTLLGNDGSDYLFGQRGNDTLTGGGGSDTFVFTTGHDTVTDFDFRVDTLALDSGLLPAEGPLPLYLSDVATFENDRIVLNFDDENSLTIFTQTRGTDDLIIFDSFEIVEF